MDGFLIIGIKGLTLTAEEREMLQHPSVAGVILFSRNYQDKQQLLALTRDIHQVRHPIIVSVDQEGGRVQRFREGFEQLPALAEWGKQYQDDASLTEVNMKQTIQTMVQELLTVGVNCDLTPVLDIDYQHNKVIGDRSFGNNVKIITELARVYIQTMQSAGMPVTGKHFPGHGWVDLDSHTDAPVDEREWSAIEQDMYPFKLLITQIDSIMPSHIIYPCVDDVAVTFSRAWLQDILRDQLHFDGVIISDDLCMQAAATLGDFPSRAKAALEAGCDLLITGSDCGGQTEIIDQVRYTHSQQTQLRLLQYISYFT